MKGFMKDFLNLFKYEILSSAKSLLFAYVLGMICYLMVSSFRNTDGIIQFVIAFVSVASFGAFFVILVLRVFHTFWREIFGAQGYLTLTLPVSLDAILLSKIFTYTFWIVVGIVLGQFILYIDEYIVELKNPFDYNLLYRCITTIFWVCFVLFITALLNALRVRSFVFIKGFLLALVFFVLKKISFFIILSPAVVYDYDIWVMWFDDSFFAILSDVIFSVLFYLGARFLITYKLELE